jgi:hypothetical protein
VRPALIALLLFACDQGPQTAVVLDNESAAPVYRAHWEAVSFEGVPPGSSSGPQPTVPASPSDVYVVLAPGWDPASGATPASFVVLKSVGPSGVNYDDTLHITVDDTTFIGNCAAKSYLPQADADFITQLVFPKDFAQRRYDATTCTTTPAP